VSPLQKLPASVRIFSFVRFGPCHAPPPSTSLAILVYGEHLHLVLHRLGPMPRSARRPGSRPRVPVSSCSAKHTIERRLCAPSPASTTGSRLFCKLSASAAYNQRRPVQSSPRCHLATWFKTSSAACPRHLQHLELSLLAVTLLACMQLIQGSNPASCKSQTFLITFCFLLASPRQRPPVLAPSSRTRDETLLLTASRLQSIFSFVRLNRHHF
jgi:hypothetical protein